MIAALAWPVAAVTIAAMLCGAVVYVTRRLTMGSHVVARIDDLQKRIVDIETTLTQLRSRR